MKTFGQRLKALRNGRGISQNELSKYIGVSKSSVNMYERDEREPGFETLEAIADFFNVDMDYLLGRGYGFHDKNMKVDVIIKETGGFSLLFRERTPKDEISKLLDEISTSIEAIDKKDDDELSPDDMLQALQNSFLKMAERRPGCTLLSTPITTVETDTAPLPAPPSQRPSEGK